MPLPFSATDHLYSREEHIEYLDAALASGDELYISRVLATLAEALGVNEREDELATLLKVAGKLGVRVAMMAQPKP